MKNKHLFIIVISIVVLILIMTFAIFLLWQNKLYKSNNHVIFDKSNNTPAALIVKSLDETDLNGLVTQLGWSDDNKYYWVKVFYESVDAVIFKIDASNNKSEKFSLPASFGDRDYQLNNNTGLIAYSNFPKFFDTTEYDAFASSKSPVNLAIYNLNTKQEKIIATSQAKEFNPIWVDDVTIQYDNPIVNNRIEYTVPANLFYDKQTEQNLISQIENWNLYQETTNTQEKNIVCDCTTNKEYLDLNAKIKEGSVKTLMLNNALLLALTPNYFNWTEKKLFSFSTDQTAVCCAGSTYPLKVYQDKILWGNSCSGGAGAPTIDCYVAEDVINNYFSKI